MGGGSVEVFNVGRPISVSVGIFGGFSLGSPPGETTQ